MAQTKFLKNINLLNILLLVAILIFVNYTILPLFNMHVRFTLPGGKTPSVQQDIKGDEGPLPSLTDYTVIADENLFHPDRQIPVDTVEDQSLPKPEFILFGTIITGETRLAYLENLTEPFSTAGRGKRQRSLRIGDTLSSYTLSEIYPDRVVMVKGDDRIEVNLTDSSAKKRSSEPSQVKQKFTPKTPAAPQSNRMRKLQSSSRPPGVVFGEAPPDIPKPDEEMTSRAKKAFMDIMKKKRAEDLQEKD